MAFNPMMLLRAKEMLKQFNERHPKVLPFFKSIKEDIGPGAVIEMKVTSADGKETVTNIRRTEEDVDTILMFIKQKDNN